MTHRFNRLALALATILGSTSAFAQTGDAFAGFAGSWSGVGTVALKDGHREAIRCKAAYDVTPSGIIMHQTLRCASDSYTFAVTSSLQATGHQIQGTWSEATRQVTGSVTGTIEGGTIATTVNATGFSATLGVQTRGRTQTVSIVPQGTDIQAVKVVMKRA